MKTTRTILWIALICVAVAVCCCACDDAPSSYVFTVYNNVGGAPHTLVIDSSAVTVASVPAKTHYVFNGYATTPTGAGGQLVVNAQGMLVADVQSGMTLYATWLPQSCTVRFDAGEGTLVAAEDIKLYYAETLPMLPVPQRQGYNFVGWGNQAGTLCYTNRMGQVLPQCATFDADAYDIDANGNCILVAQYEIMTHTVSFSYNDGSGREAAPLSIEHGQTLLQTDMPTFDDANGNEIVGWRDVYGSDNIYAPITQDTTLYAVWARYKEVQFYEALVHDATEQPVTRRVYNDGASYYYTPQNPYCDFEGWYTTATFSGQSVARQAISYDSVGTPAAQYYARYDAYVYTDIFSTGDITEAATGGNHQVVVDWRGCYDGVYSYANLIKGTSYVGSNTNLDISAPIRKVTFVGNPKATYSDLSIYLCGYQAGQQVELVFVDFHLTTAGVALSSWYNDNVDVGMQLTITAIGENEIRGVGNGNVPVTKFADVTIAGTGSLLIVGGNGADATGSGNRGSNGGAAMDIGKLTVQKGVTLTCVGGNGGNGSDGSRGSDGYRGSDGWNSWGDGANGTRGGDGSNGSAGGSGGNGASAIVLAQATVLAPDGVTLIGGRGGNGGRGGDGGNGGNGGNGGVGGPYSKVVDDGYTKHGLNGGNGGNGGYGGNGGAAGQGGAAVDNVGNLCANRAGSAGNVGSDGSRGYKGYGGSAGHSQVYYLLWGSNTFYGSSGANGDGR